MLPNVRSQRIIILPIQEEFAESIMNGRKRFEFRKTIGEHDPALVLLFVREAQAVIGAFLSGKVHRGTPDELWRLTGGEGTTLERFSHYFENQDQGVALRVRRVERFRPPITASELAASGVVLPPSFNLVYPSADALDLIRSRGVLLRDLERHRTPSILEAFERVELRAPGDSELQTFTSLVTEEIGKWYDDIGDGFAHAIVRSHKAGIDQNGLLTRRKTIHAFFSSTQTIGFSVATEKLGGSVKFGPTVLEAPFQRQGLGGMGRQLLEEEYRQRGFRKAYSTVPETHQEALRYLLKLGYRVEAHLRFHYSQEHGEFVVAKRLVASSSRVRTEREGASYDLHGTRFEATVPPLEGIRGFVGSHMSMFYGDLDDLFLQNLSRDRTTAPEDEKPRLTIFAFDSEAVRGCCCIVPKRGGAVKLAPVDVVESERLAVELLRISEDHAVRFFRPRKLYALVPVNHRLLREAFGEAGYEVEGTLAEPYKAGVDMLVYSRFVRLGER